MNGEDGFAALFGAGRGRAPADGVLTPADRAALARFLAGCVGEGDYLASEVMGGGRDAGRDRGRDAGRDGGRDARLSLRYDGELLALAQRGELVVAGEGLSEAGARARAEVVRVARSFGARARLSARLT